ncbi:MULTISPECIES: NAD(P)-dependent oxidoreductase [Prauserella salsuginis group]|uniref:NAD(P)-dependent oxidoreductase n=1 Tax=Prauserella salsuginis TaxID=387889 RepID=A0ABW6FWE1_9PSEU|nr:MULTISPECIES: NAD(P)-dependent oxidoreductase [Prauserella salsuginis group]MCR3720088.1 D-3-phosphoglycerate dehydrogenase [Prauserella flava]MCR3736366.1 D-3-phosphoglycerate dehydrogenase [Prauserella salsuginis]
MRILVADAFPDEYRAELAAYGHDCTYEPETTAEELTRALAGHDALIVRSTAVTADAVEAADSLRLVIRAGSGTNTIDRDAAARRGVYVCNVPGRNAIAVAELTMGLLLALDRSIPDNVADLRAGRWDKKRYSRARGIHGRKVGVVGLGGIGLAFAERAAAFGADVHAVAKPDRDERTLERARAIDTVFVDSLDELARTCDVLSFHVPATADTRMLVDRQLLSQLPPGAIVLNTSRGDIVDEDALIEAMESNGVRAGLDVYADEPTSSTGTVTSRLAKHPNVYGTHHIGASTEQAQHAVAAEVVRIVTAFTAAAPSDAPPHCVNLDALEQAALSSPTSTTSGGGP